MEPVLGIPAAHRKAQTSQKSKYRRDYEHIMQQAYIKIQCALHRISCHQFVILKDHMTVPNTTVCGHATVSQSDLPR
jgi:hypothetical protein